MALIFIAAQYRDDIAIGVPTLLKLISISEPITKKIILKVIAELSSDGLSVLCPNQY